MAPMSRTPSLGEVSRFRSRQLTALGEEGRKMNVNETNEVLERAEARAEKGERQVSHTPALDIAASNRR